MLRDRNQVRRIVVSRGGRRCVRRPSRRAQLSEEPPPGLVFDRYGVRDAGNSEVPETARGADSHTRRRLVARAVRVGPKRPDLTHNSVSCTSAPHRRAPVRQAGSSCRAQQHSAAPPRCSDRLRHVVKMCRVGVRRAGDLTGWHSPLSYGLGDESFGPTCTLRAVGTGGGHRWRVAHRLSPLACFSLTKSTEPRGNNILFMKRKKRNRAALGSSDTRKDHRLGAFAGASLKLVDIGPMTQATFYPWNAHNRSASSSNMSPSSYCRRPEIPGGVHHFRRRPPLPPVPPGPRNT